ncbi:hypothetical protein [Luedemannella helvata]|uniref:DUF3352 domain-containing protein n=1 Tax=Luedemannella helvata TaxID=349315 RepID=A0ABN2L4E2_9ACTN
MTLPGPTPPPVPDNAATPAWPAPTAPLPVAQPSWPAPTAQVPAFTGTDTLTTELPPRRRRLGAGRVIAAAVVTLALLAGVGAYAATMLGGGKRPAQFTPATVVAFAELDLAASLEQQIKLLKLAADLPEGAKDGKALLESWLKDAGLDGVDIKRDIMSWLDKRLAISVLPNGKDEPFALISAATTDDGKAADGLSRVDAAVKDVDLGYVVRDGGALIVIGEGDAQAAATTAADEAAKRPLADAPAFRDAVQRLDDDQLITLWTDFGAIGDLAETAGERSMVQLGDLRGTLVLGVRATTDGFEARYHLTGLPVDTLPAGGGDALARVSALPGDTQIAAATKLPELSLAANNMGGLLFGGLGGLGVLGLLGATGGMPGAEFDPDDADVPSGSPPGFTEAERKELQKLLAKERLTRAEEKRLEDLLGGSFARDPGNTPADTSEEEIKKVVTALSGASITIAVNGVPEKAAARIVAETTSASAATTLNDTLRTWGPLAGVIEPQGSTVTLTTPGYTPGAGTLGDKPEFQRATAGGPDGANVVVFVDASAFAEAGDDPIPVKSVALVQATSADTTSGLLRLILA